MRTSHIIVSALCGAVTVLIGMGLVTLPGGAAVGPGVPSPGDEWPIYGQNLWNNFFNPYTAITAATVKGLQPAWRVPAGAEVSGNAVAAAGRIYFTTWTGAVYAVDRDTGTVQWMVTLGSAPINGGPLFDGGRLFVASSDGVLYCLSPGHGTVLWRVGVLAGLPYDALRASPKAYGGVIYEAIGGKPELPGRRGGVAAVDEQTGRMLWRTDLVRYAGSGATVFAPPAIIPELNELVVATGNPTVVSAGSVAAASRSSSEGNDPFSESIVALALKDGHVLWASQTHPHDDQDFDFIAAPNVIRLPSGMLTVGAGEKDGTYYLFDAQTGKSVWTVSLGQLRTYAMIVATAAVATDRIDVGTVDIPGGLSTQIENYQAPAQGRLVTLDARSGRPLWTDSLPYAIAAAPAAGRDVVFAVEANGAVFAADAGTGRVLWTAETLGKIWHAEGGLTLAGRMLFVPLAHPGGMAAYRLP
jgi:polyvinyl alcohol dehydrogenase (cytochrome)